jgi:hypothetical protein
MSDLVEAAGSLRLVPIVGLDICLTDDDSLLDSAAEVFDLIAIEMVSGAEILPAWPTIFWEVFFPGNK